MLHTGLPASHRARHVTNSPRGRKGVRQVSQCALHCMCLTSTTCLKQQQSSKRCAHLWCSHATTKMYGAYSYKGGRYTVCVSDRGLLVTVTGMCQ